MSTVSTKHKPHVLLPAVAVREAEFPHKIEKAVHEGEAIILGLREPDEGRYDTLSRQAYQKGPRTLPGFASVQPRDRHDILDEAKQRGDYMHSKHFYWEGQVGRSVTPSLLISEQRGALQPPTSKQDDLGAQNRKNAMLMTTSSVFVSDSAVDEWKHATSTNRADFDCPRTDVMLSLKEESRRLRTMQQVTNFTLGASKEKWNSENRACFRGEFRTKVPKALSSTLSSTINIGSSDVPVSETLKSLKQVDFRPQTVAPVPHTTSNMLQQTTMVLGYAPRGDNNSLYRASYSPTMYVTPKPTTPSALPQIRQH